MKYGNPNYGNITGLISNSRRQRMKDMQLTQATADLEDDGHDLRDSEESPRRPRRRNDDEEEKLNDITGRKLISYNIGKKNNY